jgi:hypothetical protein
MGFDFSQISGQLDQVLSTLPYPIGKEQLVQRAQSAGANPQIVNAMQRLLPDRTFKSPEDIKSIIDKSGGPRM